MNYQWYPGHMTKAKRMMQENIKLVDLVIELVDARVPLSSRNPDIDDLGRNKARLLLLNKSDLADEAANEAWSAYFRAKGFQVVKLNSRSGAGFKSVNAAVQEACKEKTERDRRRGIKNRPIRAMVVGIPNVGKSTFINTFAGRACAKTGNKPGVTKGKQWVSTDKFDLLDMPGVLWKKFDSKTIASNLAFIGSIKDDILDVEELAMNLLDEVRRNYPDLVAQRYKLDAETLALPPYELMEAIGRKRGLLVRGGEVNTERCAIMLVDEFRACKWGRISLERPPQRDDLADFAEEDDE